MAEGKKMITFITIGNSSVGKSSLTGRFCNNNFEENYYSTIGIDFLCKNIIIKNQSYSLKIWDTAGQERFETITTMYLLKADGILLIFDLTRNETLKKIHYWVELINTNITKAIPMILIGNKCDLVNKREVREQDAWILANELGLDYFEVSAKSGEKVEDAFIKLANLVVEKGTKETEEKKEVLKVDVEKTRKKKKVNC